MGNASFIQSSFLGGEWSPLMQGRVDLPKYRQAMNLCQNIIPTEEGAAPRRSGTEMLAPTRLGYSAKIIGWAPTETLPYLLEFTDSNLRFFQKGQLLTDYTSYTVSSISSASPAVITISSAPGWATGDQVEFTFPAGFPGAATGELQNRQFIVVMQSTTTFNILDAVTRAPINGSTVTLVSGHYPTVARITTLVTPYTASVLQLLRWIPFTSSLNETEGVILSGQQPQLLEAATPGVGTTAFTLTPLSFTDGPYLDPVNGAVATMTAGSGTPTFAITSGNNWTPASGSLGRYNTGDGVEYQGNFYLSATGGASGTNIDNTPGTNSAWVLIDPTPSSSSPPYFTAWSNTGSYTAWNGTGGGSTVSYNGDYFIAQNRGTTSFSNTTPDPSSSVQNSLTNVWGLVNWIQVSENITGVITMTLSFAAWSPLTTYAAGDTASFGTGDYVSLTNGNLNNEPDSSPTDWATANAGLAFGPNGAQSTDVGRLIRLFYQPQTWSASVSYNAGATVSYGSPAAYYQAATDSAGQAPPASVTSWLPVAGLAFWVPGIVTAVNSSTSINVQLNGTLPDATPITTYEVGVYTDTGNQWPTCGCFYQGRLWLAGAVSNRIDSSTSDDPSTWTPTAPDGTVADDNGISFVVNSDDDETVLWMKGVQQGILVGTRTREWLISASSTNDPITPATAEINPITHYGSAFVEPKTTGLATVFAQKYQRQMLEMVANVFSGKYNAPNLALTARHLTSAGIEEIAYQEELAPVIWERMGDGSLAGCTYRRLSAIQTDNPVLLNEPSTYAAWHRHVLGTGRLVNSITTTLTPDTTLDQLAMVTQDTGATNLMLPTTPQAWFKVGTGEWNNNSAADPILGLGGYDLSGMPGPYYIIFGSPSGTVSATIGGSIAGGWGLAGPPPSSPTTSFTISNGGLTASETGGGGGYVWSTTTLPAVNGITTFFTLTLAGNSIQSIILGFGNSSGPLVDSSIPGDLTNFAGFNGNVASAEIVVNAITEQSSLDIGSSVVLSFAIYTPLTSNTLDASYVEVMQPLADVDDTLIDAWFLDGAAIPTSQTLADGNGEIIFYGYNQWAGQTVSVWSAGLDCGDFTVGSDGSVTVPLPGANGLYTLSLVQSYSGNVPTVIGTCFTSQGQIVRSVTPQDTGSRTGPAQGETRRNQMMSALLFNTQGISFGTDFAYLYPAQLAAYINGPIYPVTQLFSGVYWDTLNDTPGFDGMICWQVTRPYPATVVNIGGFIHTAER